MIVEFESLPRHQFKAYSAESESKRAETQMQDRVRFEMANIKQTRLKMKVTIATIEVEEKQESLSEFDKERIKQAVLENAAKNAGMSPDKVAESLCRAIYLIDSYKH